MHICATLQPAYLLHTRPYRDTSLLADFFTKEYGKISVVAKGARGLKSHYKSKLRPFSHLIISYSGRSDLFNLNDVESGDKLYSLQNIALFSGYYLNELLIRLLPTQDPHPTLFEFYQKTLMSLSASKNIEPALRLFEFQLLKELGYGFALDKEVDKETPIKKEYYYRFDPQQGFLCQTLHINNTFKGEYLLNFHYNNWDVNTMLSAKHLMRLALQPLLGTRPLKTREFLKQSLKAAP